MNIAIRINKASLHHKDKFPFLVEIMDGDGERMENMEKKFKTISEAQKYVKQMCGERAPVVNEDDFLYGHDYWLFTEI